MRKTNIVIIGSGGREHALSWKLSASPLAGTVYTIPGNGGIPNSIPLNPEQFDVLLAWCKEHAVDLIVAGPENVLAAGIVNYFSGSGIRVFGPDAFASQLESSKSFAKAFMEKHKVSTAAYRKILPPYTRTELFESAKAFNGKVVIKYDGLAAGKGVFVCNNESEILSAIDAILERYGDVAPLVFEQLLTGYELSYIGITDGKDIRLFQASQDHKRLLDGDRGPNTGGMGAYTPVRLATPEMDKLVKSGIIEPTLAGIQAEHMHYRGFIYFGVMVEQGIPYLLEYNVRLGDPEAEVLLPSLQSDLLEIVLATLEGNLSETEFITNSGCFVDVVLVAGGYPEAYAKGDAISGLEVQPEGIMVFHAGTKREGDKLVTAGGRVLNIVAHGVTFEDARNTAYQFCKTVDFAGKYYRNDIGARNL